MTQPKTGDIIRFTVEGEVTGTVNGVTVAGVSSLTQIYCSMTRGPGIGTSFVFLDGENRNWSMVKEKSPTYWPPQAGDVWETDSQTWVTYGSESGQVIVINSDRAYLSAQSFGGYGGSLDKFKELQPVLKYRKGLPL